MRAGEWDSDTTFEPIPHQDVKVSSIRFHPQYKSESVFNDFAILVLEHPVKLAPNVETICLPDANENFDNLRCIATGWGINKSK